MCLIAWLSDYTMKILVRTKVHMRHQGSYPELVRDAMPQSLKKFTQVLIYGMIVFTVMGVCTVYLIFCGKLLLGSFDVDIYLPIAIMATVLAVFSWVPSLKGIAFFSLLGDIALLLAMVVVVYYGFATYTIRPLDYYPAVNWATLPSFYGPVVFL
jgi:hypothetical protein